MESFYYCIGLEDIYMEIYMVGVHKKGKDIIGFRMLSLEKDNKTEIKDVAYTIVLNTLQAGLAKIHNIKLENNRIKGSNGSLDRYGIVNKSQSLVILKELHDDRDKFIGYLCSDSLGNTKRLTESEAVTFAEKLGIANGKVMRTNNSEKHISSIEGTYETQIVRQSVLQQQPKQPVQPQQQPLAQPQANTTNTSNAEKDYFRDAMFLISQINSNPERKKAFDKSFAKKIEISIKRYNKCSKKQYDVIEKEYNTLFNIQQPVQQTVQQPEKSVAKTEQPVKESTKQPESPTIQRRSYQPIVIAKPNTDMDEVLKYQIMKNGQVYVCGLNENNTETTLIIPETTVLNGKQYKITGINVGAFVGSKIKEVKTSKYIEDIGQGAFKSCKWLQIVDLSESKHTHLAMNLFNGCKSLKQINIGNQVQRIHEAAFFECSSLEYIELPDSTDTIARNAFFDCNKLVEIKHKVKNIHDSAFRHCIKLENFDFHSVISIGAYAFRETGFKHLVIPGNVTSIGTKAFADCLVLETVELQEGVQEIGEYCFAKSSYSDVIRQLRVTDVPYTRIKEITTAKSIISVLNDAFRHVELVKVYTGSTCESHCIGFNIPYERIDDINSDNSTRVRITSSIIDVNPIETLYKALSTPVENASNPEFVMNESKLVNIPFNDQQLQFFHIGRTTEQKEPHIKFKAIVNYLQDVSNLYQLPLSNTILRLQDTFYVEAIELLNDNCNRLYKVNYRLMDTLEEGSYIMVLTDNNLRYVTECNLLTDIEIENTFATNDALPVKKFLHAGDTIGKQGTISGQSSIIRIEDSYKRINVGEMLLERLKNHGITFKTTKKDSILYLPVCGLALNLHDGRIWDRPGVISKNTKDCINLINILNYDEMKNTLKNTKKNAYNATRLFDDLAKMSDRAVKVRISNLATIEDEKEAQLFQVSKHFRDIIDKARLNEVSITPNLITPEIFMELSRSYWMVSKDEQWLSSTGNKALNKMNEYSIGKYKLIEYKSNQIVKFNNPYMNGQKGAFVFTLMQGGNIIGVYASRYSIDIIVKKLYALTDMSKVPEDEAIPVLMQSAENIDKVNPNLFYTFYDVLQSKNGWNFNTMYSNYNYSASFHISMYKPTGIFYLTLNRVTISERKVEGNKEKFMMAYKVMPLLPIGNMDRALMVATTTNTNAKDSKLLEELMAIMSMEEIRDNRMVLGHKVSKIKYEKIRDNYIQARQLVINGDKDISKYKALIDDRAVYMLGTLHKGKLQREKDVIDNTNIVDDIDLDESFDIEENDTDEIEDININDEDYLEEIELDEDELDIEEDSDNAIISEKEFIEIAKSQGVTDINTIKAMYLKYSISQQSNN